MDRQQWLRLSLVFYWTGIAILAIFFVDSYTDAFIILISIAGIHFGGVIRGAMQVHDTTK